MSAALAQWSSGDSVALVPRPPLGDGLLSLVMAWNLQRAGLRVTLVHDHLAALSAWLGELRAVARSDAGNVHASIALHHAPDTRDLVRGERSDLVARTYPEILHRHAPRAEVLANLVQHLFGLDIVTEHYSLVPPAEAQTRSGSRRVVLLHPESGEPARAWPARRFLQLADRLRAQGFTPRFLAAPSERERWEQPCAAAGFELVAQAELSRVAHEMMGARALIGNDSGLGHLAAALDLPSVVLFTRRRVAERWAPRSAGGRVEWVLPPFELPATFLQRTLWKHTVGLSRVLAAWERLLPASEGAVSGNDPST